MAENNIVEREISRSWTVHPEQASPIHTVGMVLEPGQWARHDPFLFLAEDWFEEGTFDFHPHRGIETVTYVISGKLTHYDNKFGEGTLLPGDVQWMTAGRGVIHKEDAAKDSPVHSLQLWVNLPRDDKMTEPRYQNMRGQDMPLRQEEGVAIRVFSGSSAGVAAPTQNYVPVTMVEINVEPGYSVSQDLPGDYNGFLYVLDGSGTFGSNHVEGTKGTGLWLGSAEEDKPSAITIRAKERLRVLLYAGRPLHQPVVAYGPFVMNTKEQIREAFEDYQAGRFGK
ncbi:pirin family protein [Alicyclobacillus dauci]|uniref:Pirin family protein n=1 Tax=Alicyclobacillus dauci TaxID=1475485 RepID=A0ABY6ZB36_9BACL|nr:pirin family protein [Alicyclobacillus dauci]WAH39341.1 pirin family protein [Alicyclobacillus dauci]